MARYIDADQLIKKIYPMGIGDGMYVINAKAVKFAIDNAPTADVVPKSECDKWKQLFYDAKKVIGENAQRGLEVTLEEVEKAKTEVVDEFVERLKEQPIKRGLPLFGLSTKDEIEEYFNGIMLQVRDAIDSIAEAMKGGAE